MTNGIQLRKLTIILSITNILFLVYYFYVALYTRLLFDTYNMIMQIRVLGVFAYVKELYETTSGRFVFFFIHSVVYRAIDLTGSYFYWPLIFLLVGAFSIFFVLRKTIKPFSNLLSLNIAFVIFNIYIITGFDFGTFFWLPGTQYYVQPIFLLLALYTINFGSESPLKYIPLFILGVVLGGLHEAFTPFCFLFFAFNLYVIYRSNNSSIKEVLKDNRFKYLMFTSTIISIAFIIMIMAPGNQMQLGHNSDYTPATSKLDLLMRSAKIFAVYLYFMLFRIPYFLFLFVVFAYLGFQLRSEIQFKNRYFKYIKFFIPFYLIYIWLSTLPNAYLLPKIGIFRAYTHTYFLTITGVCVFSFLFGLEIINTAGNWLQKALMIAGILMVAGMILNICYDVPKLKAYAESDEKRIEYLLQLKAAKNKEVVAVEPLKTPYAISIKYLTLKAIGKKKNFQPVPFYLSEFETNPHGRNNMAIMKYYDLGFPVVRKQN